MVVEAVSLTILDVITEVLAMQLSLLTSLLAGASSLPLASAQLDSFAKKAGLKYFGAATDSPGQRERAGLQAAYGQYDAILKDPKEFGQTTPTNGMKVSGNCTPLRPVS